VREDALGRCRDLDRVLVPVQGAKLRRS